MNKDEQSCSNNLIIKLGDNKKRIQGGYLIDECVNNDQEENWIIEHIIKFGFEPNLFDGV